MKLWTLWNLRKWETKTHNKWVWMLAKLSCRSSFTTLLRLLHQNRCQSALEWTSLRSNKFPGFTAPRTGVQAPQPTNSNSLMMEINSTPLSSSIKRWTLVKEAFLMMLGSALTTNLLLITRSPRIKVSPLRSSRLQSSITLAIFSMMSVNSCPPMCLPNRS